MIRTAFVSAVAALTLGGCVSLLPEADPVTLYQLNPPRPSPTAGVFATPVNIILSPIDFTRTASGDRITAINGGELLPIGGARWAAPAQILFEESLINAFDGAPSLEVAARGGSRSADMTLRVEVRTFEAQYRNGEDAPPTIVVEARGLLNDLSGNRNGGQQVFQAEVQASENRVGSIVEAFNSATGRVQSQIVRWTNQNAAPTS